jgi:peptide/nickel transport system substrate-binding protein
VELVIDAKEFNAVREDFGRLDFDVYSGAWSQDPLPQDPKQLWSTEAAVPGAGNRMGFGDAASDQLIDEIRTTLDADLRDRLMLKLQEMLYDAQPGIFLFAPQERIAISNKFDGKATPMRPGFFMNNFKLSKPAQE